MADKVIILYKKDIGELRIVMNRMDYLITQAAATDEVIKRNEIIKQCGDVKKIIRGIIKDDKRNETDR